MRETPFDGASYVPQEPEEVMAGDRVENECDAVQWIARDRGVRWSLLRGRNPVCTPRNNQPTKNLELREKGKEKKERREKKKGIEPSESHLSHFLRIGHSPFPVLDFSVVRSSACMATCSYGGCLAGVPGPSQARVDGTTDRSNKLAS